MVIGLYSPSIVNVYSAKSINNYIRCIFSDYTDQQLDFICTVFRLLESLNKNEITTDDIALEMAIEENDIIKCLRKWNKAGLVYIDKYTPQYTCKIKDDFLLPTSKPHASNVSEAVSIEKAFNALEYTDFINRLIKAIKPYKQDLPLPKELSYYYKIKEESSLSDGVIIEIVSKFLKADGSLSAYDIISLIDFSTQWNSIASVQKDMELLTNDYAFVKLLMKKQGYKGKPTRKELLLYRKWRDEWHFSDDDILNINKSLVDGDYAMEYLDGTLHNMYVQRRNEDIRSSEEEMELLREILRLIGGRKINQKCLTTFTNLREQYPADVLRYAAECASRLGTKRDKWYQIQKLLNEWSEQKLKSLSEIEIYEGKKEGVLPF